MKKDKQWYIEFWDFGAWNIGFGGPYKYKAEAIVEAQRLNKETKDKSCFEGHSFRVRKR